MTITYKVKLILLSCMVFIGIKAGAQTTDTTSIATATKANVARYNHYYLPSVALQHKEQLALSAAQVNNLKNIEATLNLKKTETEISTKRNEHMLDSLFRTGRVNEGVIIFYTNRYGLYEGEYRGAVLVACYNTHKVLTPAQLNKLISLENHN